ncbi:MAG: hypothetical protein ACRD59_01460 [Candidatus Acidiferrales bacterium]
MQGSRLSAFALGIGLLFTAGAAARVPQSGASAGSASQSAAAKPSSSSPDAIEADETLSLTQEQRDKIASIRSDAKKQTDEIAKDKTLTDDQRTRKLKQVTKETRAQVFAVLTPEQQKTWSAEQRERREAKHAAK